MQGCTEIAQGQVMAGGGGHQSTQAQTEAIRLLRDEEPAVEALKGPVTIYVAKKVITLEADQREATAVAVVDGRILAVGSLEQVKATISDGHLYHIDSPLHTK